MGSDSREKVISIVPLSSEDLGLVFEWRNSDKIVSLSSSQIEVSWEDHSSWINSSINNPSRKVYLIDVDGQKIGQVRFEKKNELSNMCDVSIYIVDPFSKQGFGKEALKAGCEKILLEWKNLTQIWAFIRKENIYSQNFFQKSNFSISESRTLKGHQGYVLQKEELNQLINVRFYSNLVEQHGLSVKSLNWGSVYSQNLRFKVLSEI